MACSAGRQPVHSPVTRHGWIAGCCHATCEPSALARNALRPTCRNVQRRILVQRIGRAWSSVGLARTRLPQQLSLSREMNVTQMNRAFDAIAPPVVNTIAALSRASSAHVGFPREAAARKGLRSIVVATATTMSPRMSLRHLRFALILRTVKGDEGNAIFSVSDKVPTRVVARSSLQAACSPKKYWPELASRKKGTSRRWRKKSNDPRSALQPHQLRGEKIPKP